MKAKRSLALLLALVMTLSLLAIPAFAADNKTRATPLATKFSDTAGHWAAAAIDRWSGFGVVVGDETGAFRPNADLTRGEMATVITNLLGLTNKGKNPYADLKGSEWYANSILKCTAAGIIYGDGVNCNATAKITRQEATVMLCRAVGIKPVAKPNLSAFSDAASVAPWAAGHVSAMANAGIISGVGGGLFAPTTNINRASTMTILDKAISEYINKAGEYTITNSGLVVVTVPNVVLKNSKLNDLLVAEGVGNGDFTLNSTKVTGNTTVRGGGVNSFIVMGDSEMGSVTVSKVDGAVRVSVQGDAKVQVVYIDDGKDDVFVEGKVGSVTVSTDTPVTLRGVDVKTVTATVENANITVDNNSKVETVASSSPNTTVNVAGTVTTVAGTKEATGLNVNVSTGGTATNVVTAAPNTTLSNDGKVGQASFSTEATGAKIVVGSASTIGKVVNENKANLTVTTAAAEKAAKAEAAAKAAADKAAADKIAAEIAAANAKTEAEKAAAAAAQKAADAAAAKAAAEAKAAADAAAAAKAEADKVKETTKVEEKPVAPPKAEEDGTVTVPEQPKPTPEPPVDPPAPPAPTHFTVTFMPNGADIGNKAPSAQTVVSGGKATAPGGIGKGGYTFHGWFTTADFQGTRWDFSNTVTGNTTLYAKWEKYTEADVDEIIRGGIFDVNSKMVMSEKDKTTYAQLLAEADLADNAVTVNITNGTVDVAKVYTDIITTLVAALKDKEAHIATLTIGKAAAIDVPVGIRGEDIKNIVKASGLTGANGNIAGGDKISVLYTQSTTATVKDVNGKTYTYTLTFVDNTKKS